MLPIGGDTVGIGRKRGRSNAKNDADLLIIHLNPFDQGRYDLPACLCNQPVTEFFGLLDRYVIVCVFFSRGGYKILNCGIYWISHHTTFLEDTCMTYCGGRLFLQIPGPTNVPDRILRATDRPTIDHRGSTFSQFALEVLEGIKTIFQTSQPVNIYPGSGTGAWHSRFPKSYWAWQEILAANNVSGNALWCSDGTDACWHSSWRWPPGGARLSD